MKFGRWMRRGSGTNQLVLGRIWTWTWVNFDTIPNGAWSCVSVFSRMSGGMRSNETERIYIIICIIISYK